MDTVKSRIIKEEMASAISYSFIILTANSSFSHVPLLTLSPLFFLFIPLFPPPSGNLATNEGGNRYHNKNLLIKILTILPENIISIHGKIIVKTANVAYFNKLKKHSKV